VVPQEGRLFSWWTGQHHSRNPSSISALNEARPEHEARIDDEETQGFPMTFFFSARYMHVRHHACMCEFKTIKSIYLVQVSKFESWDFNPHFSIWILEFQILDELLFLLFISGLFSIAFHGCSKVIFPVDRPDVSRGIFGWWNWSVEREIYYSWHIIYWIFSHTQNNKLWNMFLLEAAKQLCQILCIDQYPVQLSLYFILYFSIIFLYRGSSKLEELILFFNILAFWSKFSSNENFFQHSSSE